MTVDYSELVKYEGRWKIERWITRIERWGTVLFLLMIIGLVVAQVVTRFVFSSPPPWTEEFARYALIWMTFIGAAWLVAINDHITVHSIDMALKTRGKIVLDILVQLIQGTLASFIVLYSPAFLERVSSQYSAAGNLSMGWVYASVAIGFALIVIHTLFIVAKDILALAGKGDLEHLRAQGVTGELKVLEELEDGAK